MPDKAAPLINTVRCSGCGRCVSACPERLITLEVTGHRKHGLLVNPEQCSNCGTCITACLLEAITLPFSP